MLKSMKPSLENQAVFPSNIPHLLVVIDTEEEFNWSQPFSRENTSVRAMRSIERVQTLFDAYGVVPTYVIDYPIASQPDGYLPLQELLHDGRAVIGAHLHPWVNPPYTEPVNPRNSFHGNLPLDLERDKVKNLTNCIQERLGYRPIIFKAGRYGVGPNTIPILKEMGYSIDLSVCPYMNYSSEEGPDFSMASPWPSWLGVENDFLEIPLTVGYTGYLKAWGYSAHQLIDSRLMRAFHAPGVFSRFGLLNKVWLSPEGYETWEHLTLVRSLFQVGLRVFSFAFHSPSVEPGCTPYVQSQSDLDNFLDKFKKFFDFFFGEMGGVASTPLEIKTQFTNSG